MNEHKISHHPEPVGGIFFPVTFSNGSDQSIPGMSYVRKKMNLRPFFPTTESLAIHFPDCSGIPFIRMLMYFLRCSFVVLKFPGTILFLIVLLSFFAGPHLQAQESSVSINHQGKDHTQLKHAWTAQWITHPRASTLDYGVFLFRKDFDLNELPDSFMIYISADNRYRLYVNGTFVCEGPAEGDLLNWRYETLDLVPYLHRGKNTLAVAVINFGEYRKAAQQTFQTALILQGEKDLPVNVNTGSMTWKVIRDDAYEDIPFVSDSLGAYYAAGPGDRMDASLHPWGWQLPGYDDSLWLTPKKATVEFAVGRGFLYGSTWFLVPRRIPLMERTVQRFPRIVRAEGIRPSTAFLEGTAPLRIAPHRRVTLLLDLTRHSTGYPSLTWSRGRESRIRITYAEALYKTDETPKMVTDGNLIYYDLKGDRNNTRNKEIRGIYDILLPDGGVHRLFIPWGRRTLRFVQMDIITAEEPLVLEDYHMVRTVYPFREKAHFESNDSLLTRIWEVAWRTIRNSSAETYMDPYFEQLQYIGDTRIEALVSLYVSGDDRLMRKALRQFNDSRLPNGLTQSRYPAYITQVIPTYSLLWIDMVHDYYMLRDDDALISSFLPGIRDVLGWFIRHIDERMAMLTGLEWWNFTDWTEGFQNGIPPGADDGYSANVTLQLVLALQNAAELFDHFGKQDEAEKYRTLASSLIRGVYHHCYDAGKGLFAETPEKRIFSQHTNIWAILTNALPPEQQPALMRHVLSDTSLIRASIYFRFYLFRALQKTGMGNHYTSLLEPWERMLRNGMTTFGETDLNPRSECHGWSASPCFDMLHTVAGIGPGSPGFATVIIQPNPGKLTRFRATLPHPAGMITVDYTQKKREKVSFLITLPEELEGAFRYGDTTVLIHPGTQILNLQKTP